VNIGPKRAGHLRTALSPEQADFLRRVLASHGNDPASGACLSCGVPCCSDWCYAYDQLALAGEVMAEPKSWQSDERPNSNH
jgi:hypothetical protein